MASPEAQPLPRPYALPIHYAQPRGGHISINGAYRLEQIVQEETQLRRKTPSGTLSAGYDASSSDMLPHKHQLLPGTPKQHMFAPGDGSKLTFAQHQQRYNEQLSRSPFAWSSFPSPMPVMDSLLHQDFNYASFNQGLPYVTVPSVVQPPFQHIGPTASGSFRANAYGPYFYDGTFVPYRAAAVRDPRFYHFHAAAGNYSPGPWTPPHNLAASPLAAGWTSPPNQWNRHHSVPSIQHDLQQLPELSAVWSPRSVTSYDFDSRDRIHAWALQQYKDLLSFLQRTRKHSVPSRHQPQPRYYPKPPVRRASSHTPRTDLTPVPSDGPTSDPSRRQSLPWSPHGISMHDNEYQRRASHDHSLSVPTTSTISPFNHHMPFDESPTSQAALALQQITTQCQADGWKWVDGMHLGGCLAYGLGNYAKALRWYEKVLEIEPGHLEVTSNLAATYLALNRKEEAEKHWIKVVKAAPNHFEAVEHLLGLLCTSNRSEAAIKVIEYVERVLKNRKDGLMSDTSAASPDVFSELNHDSSALVYEWKGMPESDEPGFGTSGYAIPGCENGRILALIHAKGNIYYTMGKIDNAAKSFEEAVLIATGRAFQDIRSVIQHVLKEIGAAIQGMSTDTSITRLLSTEPILLSPEQALATARLCFPATGELPGLQFVPGGNSSMARRAVLSTTSNSLLSLAKIYQDTMSSAGKKGAANVAASGVRDILALYYLSLSLQPSPSTANNVGILLAGVQQISPLAQPALKLDLPGVIPGSGIALALQYYNYGLQLDQNHAHLYTNLGSLLKDIGQLDAAISMYERAVKCDPRFDIALANLANAVKDRGRMSDAIVYYKRAVDANPQFAEAVCGLANALNSVCNWQGRGGLLMPGGKRDRWHVDGAGMLVDAKQPSAQSSGWIKHVVGIVDKQLTEGLSWGRGILTPAIIEAVVSQCLPLTSKSAYGGTTNTISISDIGRQELSKALQTWSGRSFEGARLIRLIERATRRISWQWYQDLYVTDTPAMHTEYVRPQLPAALAVPSSPTVLPFHCFTLPLTTKQIRLISQRNGLRISALTLKAPWLPTQVFRPPAPPNPYLKVGYVSSDFNNHPLAHLMQSAFGLHTAGRVLAHCYATTASDGSIYRSQIERECPVFRDASSWSAERLVKQIVDDGIHILINLNGYTRGARNEVFAARPAPILMSFMGFAGTLGAEWCDYLLADTTAIPPAMLRPWRRNITIRDQLVDENYDETNDDWLYAENVIYCRDTFFCCDHKQSSDPAERHIPWLEGERRRWQMRRDLFPQLTDSTVIFGNFNQLYKIDPTTFRSWLRILARVPNAVLWLLRFPDLGESHLRATAELWAGSEVASRIIFTDVAAKHLHISRARICDLVLDTPECNAHTTAADVLWSGTPILTLPRYEYKMCSRIAASILKGALPKTQVGREAADQLIANSDQDYEDKAVTLASSYRIGTDGSTTGRLSELRKLLCESKWTSGLFDTARWVRDLEDAYEEAWKRYVAGEGGDIWLTKIPARAS